MAKVDDEHPIHVLEYLEDPECKRKPQNARRLTEYRLLCSGTIYRPINGNWSHSEASRVLLEPPLWLYAASRPFEEYPLELALRLTTVQVEENRGRHVRFFHPDAEVARDLSALLTVLCRRLITVSGASMFQNSGSDDYVPLALATSMRKVYWPPHPATVVTWSDRQAVVDHTPPEARVDPGALTRLLLGLPRIQPKGYAESIVASARLYALAMELIREQPDIAYQLLISSVETMANEELENFQPDDEAKLEKRRPVFKLAVEMGLGEDKARKLALEACRDDNWVGRKFKKFLADHVDHSVWDEDDLFGLLPEALPRREDLKKTLGIIYKARSKATHEGQPFPFSASYAGGTTIPARVAMELFSSGSVFPPVAWFERLVNTAIKAFWKKEVTKALGLPAQA